MSRQLQSLTELALEVQSRPVLEELLQAVVDKTGPLLQAHHASIRLLDPSGQRLLAVCRTGEPLHAEPVAFDLGEGLIGWIVQHGESIRTATPAQDPRFVSKPGVLPMGPFVGVPLLSRGTQLGVLSVVRKHDAFTAADQQLLTLVAAICAPYLEIARLSRLSQVDPLTGVLNRRGLDTELEGQPANPEKPEIAVVMVDIDHFKRVNDTRGHAVGDSVLRHIARILGQNLRSTDSVTRYGGEEFLMVLPELDQDDAMRVAQRAREAVENQPAQVAGEAVPVTISLGVAGGLWTQGLRTLIDRADAALYEAKQSGRNKVIAASS